MFSQSAITELFVATYVGLRGRYRRMQESGATAVEYALMVGLMALAIIGSVAYFGRRITTEFNVYSNAMPTYNG
jgi:pilus assembly protein Flp/PilA